LIFKPKTDQSEINLTPPKPHSKERRERAPGIREKREGTRHQREERGKVHQAEFDSPSPQLSNALEMRSNGYYHKKL